MSAPLAPDKDYNLDTELDRGRRDGSLLRGKARMVLEHFAIPGLVDDFNAVNTPLSLRLEIAKFFSKLGDMDPKPGVAANTAPSLSVTINLPAPHQAGHDMRNITPGGDAATPPTITMALGGMRRDPIIQSDPLEALADDLPPLPAGFKMPNFALTRDLIGPPIPETPYE